MTQISRKVTIFKGTRKYLATSYEAERRASALGNYYITFKPKGARNLRVFEDALSKTVIVEGWDHPEFDDLIRASADAPVRQLSEGVSVRNISETITRGSVMGKSKYQREFEGYLKNLEPSLILLETRKPT